MNTMKAVPWGWDRKHSMAQWLYAHGLSLIRATVVTLLCMCTGLLAWQLLRPLIHHFPAEAQDAAVDAPYARPVPRAVLVARIQDRHLFGDSRPAAATAPVLTSSGSVSVIGIVYSPDAAESVALLSVAGDSVVSRVGSQLATGQTVTAILPDRVQIGGAGGAVSLLLGIKQADTDQRISQGQYAGVSGYVENPADTAPDAPLGAGTAPAALPQAGLAPTNFVSLKSLRGGNATQRFQGLNAPLPGHRPPR